MAHYIIQFGVLSVYSVINDPLHQTQHPEYQ